MGEILTQYTVILECEQNQGVEESELPPPEQIAQAVENLIPESVWQNAEGLVVVVT